MKSKIISGAIYAALWLAFGLALLSSVSHLAYTFGTMERQAGWGWVSALAVDASLAALAYTIQQKRRLDRPVIWLWVGVAFFSFISALANFYYALSVEVDATMTLPAILSVDGLQVAKAIILSATLPAMVIYLGEVVSSNDAQEAAEREQEKRKAEARAEREQRREDAKIANESKRLELEQRKLDAEQQRLAQEEQRQQEQIALEQSHDAGAVFCEQCQLWFKNRQAEAAHRCHKKLAASNGKPHAQ